MTWARGVIEHEQHAPLACRTCARLILDGLSLSDRRLP
ncbi:Hypothetical protein A7982_02363 [Minicystis rosea]|nr:Hypothetical protein A7982_02363 [Minicystis rosea]